jgi:hypothetical protein
VTWGGYEDIEARGGQERHDEVPRRRRGPRHTHYPRVSCYSQELVQNGPQQSGKTGSRSSSRKLATSRHGSQPMPATTPVAGAFGRTGRLSETEEEIVQRKRPSARPDEVVEKPKKQPPSPQIAVYPSLARGEACCHLTLAKIWFAFLRNEAPPTEASQTC